MSSSPSSGKNLSLLSKVIYRHSSPVLLDWFTKGRDGHIAIQCLRAEEQAKCRQMCHTCENTTQIRKCKVVQGTKVTIKNYRLNSGWLARDGCPECTLKLILIFKSFHSNGIFRFLRNSWYLPHTFLQCEYLADFT